MVRGSRVLRLFDGSPGLFAAFHALHRLPTPRHPPCALLELDHADRRLRLAEPVRQSLRDLGKTFRPPVTRSPGATATRRVTKDATRTLFIELSKSLDPRGSSVLVTRNRRPAGAAFVSDRVARGFACRSARLPAGRKDTGPSRGGQRRESQNPGKVSGLARGPLRPSPAPYGRASFVGRASGRSAPAGARESRPVRVDPVRMRSRRAEAAPLGRKNLRRGPARRWRSHGTLSGEARPVGAGRQWRRGGSNP